MTSPYLPISAPYVLWATFAYRRFCVALGYPPAASGSATVASLPAASAAAAAAAAEWCHRPMPDLYAHVQSKYWGVGALRYYQWRQAPNFALAAPALGLCASACLAALAALRPTTAPPTAATSTGGGGDEQRLLSARRAAARFLPLTSRQPIDARWATRSDQPANLHLYLRGRRACDRVCVSQDARAMYRLGQSQYHRRP